MAAKKLPSLRVQEHQEAMDFLRMAESTNNPAIAKIAASMAQERMRHRQDQENKISPGLAVGLVTLIGVAAVVGCGFTLVRYPERTAIEISGIIVGIAVLLIGSYALFSGHLTQANFMIIFKWFTDHIKSIFSRSDTTDAVSLSAEGANQSETKLKK